MNILYDTLISILSQQSLGEVGVFHCIAMTATELKSGSFSLMSSPSISSLSSSTVLSSGVVTVLAASEVQNEL